MFSEENKHVVVINYLTADEKKNLLSVICAKYILYVLFSAVLRLQGVDENSCKKWMGLNIYIIINQQPTKGYMTVTLHFINAQWQLRSKVLSTSTTLVKGSDDAQNLDPGMQKVFQARGTSEKVKTITSDNSPNVKAAVELLQVKTCFSHTINLAMKDVIRN